MQIQPTDNVTFGNKFFKFTKKTSYGKRIVGSSKNYDYDVYVAENPQNHNIEYKLYCVWQDNKWVKSFLRYFNGNKLQKEIRSKAK